MSALPLQPGAAPGIRCSRTMADRADRHLGAGAAGAGIKPEQVDARAVRVYLTVRILLTREELAMRALFSKTLYCSFCGKSQHEVAKLIAVSC